ALKKRGWIEADAHRLVRLTPCGLQIVKAVMAKRVVLEAFFSQVLGVPEGQAKIDSCKIEHLISHSTGERLAVLLRFLASDADAKALLQTRFRRFHAKCPKNHSCGVCKEECLVDEMKRAI